MLGLRDFPQKGLDAYDTDDLSGLFGIAGHAMGCLSAGALRFFLINACKFQINSVSLQRI